MRAPDAALLRARARAPLGDLQVLHLSSADISCLKNLEVCRLLRSLYANANLLRVVTGLELLRRLWRIDLSDNHLSQVQPLASFSALGFVNLERNQLSYESVVCLRDVHIVELRLSGNRLLLDASAVTEFRMKAAALLPYVWILDGHFVSTDERAQALEQYDDFVVRLLARHSESSAAQTPGLRFGSTSEVWGGGGALEGPVQEDALRLLDIIAKQPTRNPRQQDLYRLKAIALFHDSECDVHNAHVQFAPVRHAATAKQMPRIRLQQIQQLPRRTRLELSVLLAAHLDFRLPPKLMAEALTIALLSEGSTAGLVDELLQLPPYGVVALLSTLRSHVLSDTNRSHLSPLESHLWSSFPVVTCTLLKSERQTRLVETETPGQAYVQRCAFAIGLLSKAASFPDRPASGGTTELADLVEAAKYASTQTLEGLGFVIPSILTGDRAALDNAMNRKKKSLTREYRRPWSEAAETTTVVVSVPHVASGRRSSETWPDGSTERRLPKPGEWLELRQRVFLKVRALSPDGSHITASSASAPATTNALATLRLDQLTHVSSSVWRLVDTSPDEMNALLSLVGQPPQALRGRLGKLHRDSEGFHKHGAARNQGYPNRDVSQSDLGQLKLSAEDMMAMATQPQPVELFCSSETLDSNYVLASPALVSVQNACAAKAFAEQQRAPAGLWSPIHSASYQVARSEDPTDNNRDISLKGSTKKLKKVKAQLTTTEDDWRALQRDMQALLGLKPDPETDVECFMTAVPPPEPEEPLGACLDKSASSPQLFSSNSMPPTSLAKPKRLAALSWHQVSTKPQLLVSAPPQSDKPIRTSAAAMPSLSPSEARADEPAAATADAGARPWSSSSTSSKRRLTYHVSLPTLSIQSQN